MTKNEPKDIRIKQIIDSAVQEFVEKGYERSSMESIAKRANLTKGGLYYHFDNKDQILIEANNRYMQPVFALMEEARKDSSPTRGLKIFIKKYLKHWSSHPRELVFTFLSLAKVLSTQDMWVEMEHYLNQVVGFYEEMLSNGISRQELKEHDCRTRAVALVSSLDGITPYLIMCNGITHTKLAEKFIDLYIREIEIQPKSGR